MPPSTNHKRRQTYPKFYFLIMKTALYSYNDAEFLYSPLLENYVKMTKTATQFIQSKLWYIDIINPGKFTQTQDKVHSSPKELVVA